MVELRQNLRLAEEPDTRLAAEPRPTAIGAHTGGPDVRRPERFQTCHFFDEASPTVVLRIENRRILWELAVKYISRRGLGVTMIGVNRMLGMLKAQRQELLGQLDAIDKAIAAFAGAGTPAEATGRVKSRPMQSDSHKEAIRAGKRRARAAREASKGLAREMPD